ncbi:MAG: hypothetical protein AAF212_09775 [Verrucomicrobiota bacterium]
MFKDLLIPRRNEFSDRSSARPRCIQLLLGLSILLSGCVVVRVENGKPEISEFPPGLPTQMIADIEIIETDTATQRVLVKGRGVTVIVSPVNKSITLGTSETEVIEIPYNTYIQYEEP